MSGPGWVREALEEDTPAVLSLIAAAFGRADEARLVERLAADGDAELAFVAGDGDAVVGHALLSRMVAPFPALGLAPLSVHPDAQGRGIGATLVRTAADEARRQGWSAIFVYGDGDYYSRFGFRADLASDFTSPHAGPHLLVLPLVGDLPARTGTVEFAPAFDAMG